MRKEAGILVAACFYYSGLVKLARWTMRRSEGQLIILNYHRATGGDLRRHLLYLRRHYRMLHLEEALEELYLCGKTKKQRLDRRTPLVLTFDDGYRDAYTHGFALAQELQIPITIFLIPGYIESSDRFWWLEGRRLAHHATIDEVTLSGCTYHLGNGEERDLLAQKIDGCLRHASSVVAREAFLKEMRDLLRVPADAHWDGASRPLTWAEVHEMAQSELVSFGAHTMYHPILAYLSDTAELQREVGECRSILEQHLGRPVRTFAYPVGRSEHIGEEALQAVRTAGYTWAVTTTNGFSSPKDNPHLLRRVLGDVTRHWLVMAAETSGVWSFFSPLWKWSKPAAKLRNRKEQV